MFPNSFSWAASGGGATGGGRDAVFYVNSIYITADYTIPTDCNAMTAGPVQINTNITVTIPNGSTWTVV